MMTKYLKLECQKEAQIFNIPKKKIHVIQPDPHNPGKRTYMSLTEYVLVYLTL